MNHNYEFASKKTLLILLFICMMFVLLIGRAFDYIPEESNDAKNPVSNNIDRVLTKNNNPQISMQEEMQKMEAAKSQEESDVESQKENLAKQADTDIALQEQKTEQANVQPSPEEALKPIDENEISVGPIPNPEVVDNSKAEEAPVKEDFSTAGMLKEQGNYEEAISLYKKIATTQSVSAEKANCYEEIANIYVLQKRYGSALIYAQKAYNLSPSSSRELLLKKLYEKTPNKVN